MSLRIHLRLPDPLAADNDRDLVARFAEFRDESAFAGLVSRHARMVLGVCRRTVRDAHLAEDAFQAVFLVLARKPRQAAAASSVGGWLFGIARRVGMAARRQEIRRQKRETAKTSDEVIGKPAEFDDLLRILDDELASLPAAYRAPLVACFLEERTQDEAARQLGWSLSTLRRRLERGKQLLHDRLVRRGLTLAAGLLAGAVAPSARASIRPALLSSVSPTATPTAFVAALAAEAVRGAGAVKIGMAALVLLGTVGGLALGIAQSFPAGSKGEALAIGPIATHASVDSPRHWMEVGPSTDSVEVRPGTSVLGQVLFPKNRRLPEPELLAEESIKDRDFFLASGPLFRRDVEVDLPTRGIANVVVWLRPDSDDPRRPFPPDRIHRRFAGGPTTDRLIETGRESFSPRVTVARAGDRLVFGNPHPVPFNIHYQPAATDGEFNVLLPAGKSHTTRPLPHLAGPNFFSDSIHSWLRGWVWVFDHPYFALTDARGSFRFDDVPAGRWRLVIWHDTAGYGPGGRLGIPVNIGTEKVTLEPVVFESEKWGKE